MASTGGPVVADQRLYLTKDRSRAVPEGDPEAWTLFCTPGSLVPRSQAARYGLLEPALPAPGGEAQDGQEEEPPKQQAAQTKPRAARTKPRTAARKGDSET